MATVLNAFSPEQDEEAKKAQQAQAGTAGAPAPVQPTAVSSGQAATITDGGSAGGPSSSGRFTNIQKYINANSDFKANQGGLAGSISNNIGNAAQGVKSNIGDAKIDFQAQADAQKQKFVDPVTGQAPAQPVSYNPYQSQRVSTQPVSGQQPTLTIPGVTPQAGAAPTQAPQSFLQQAVTDPAAFAQNQDNVAKLAAMRDAEYKGPQSLLDLQGKNNLGNLDVGVQNVKSLSQQAGNEAGRFNLLRTMFGKPSYTSGQQRLDNLVLQGNQDQAQKLQATRQFGNEAARSLEDTKAATADIGQQYKGLADQTRNVTRNSLGQAVSDFDTGMGQKAQDLSAERQAEVDRAQQDLRGGEVDPDILNKLGLKEGDSIYNVDLAKYLNRGGIDATKQNVASTQDYARAQALKQLIGNTADPNRSAILDSFGSPEQADQFINSDKFNVDQNSMQDAINQARLAFADQSRDPMTAINQSRGALEGGETNDWMGQLGGLNNVIKSAADSYRQSLNSPVYGSADLLGPGSGFAYDPNNSADFQTQMNQYQDNQIAAQKAAIGGMSDDDVLRYMKANSPYTSQNNYFLPPGAGDVDRVLNQASSERQKLADNQAKYNQLKAMFQADRTIKARHPETATVVPPAEIGPRT